MSTPAEGILHEAAVSKANAAALAEEPFVVYGARLFPDGDHWCALLGENLQAGVSGFGKSPAAAVRGFNEAWYEKLPDFAKAEGESG